MEVTKNRGISQGITILCLVSATVAFPRVKRQMVPGNPWFGGEFEGAQMPARPYNYQAANRQGNTQSRMQPFSQLNSAGQRMAGPQMMFAQGAEIEPTQPADIEPAEGFLMGTPAMGGFNARATNPALQNSLMRQQLPNNINRGLPPNFFAMAGPMGEVEPSQAPEIEPTEIIMPMNPFGAMGGRFPMNSMWNNMNNIQQYPRPSQATPSFFDYGRQMGPFPRPIPNAGNEIPSNNQASPRASLSNIRRPQMNPPYLQNPYPTEIPIQRNPPRVGSSVPVITPVSDNSSSTLSQNPVQTNQVPPVARAGSVLAVQPLHIIPAQQAVAVPSTGRFATPTPAAALAIDTTEAPQAPPPAPVSNNQPINPGPVQVGPVIVPPKGSVQAPPPVPALGEIEPTQAPDIEPTESALALNQANVRVKSLPFQPGQVAGPIDVAVDRTGAAPPQQNPLSRSEWRGYVF